MKRTISIAKGKGSIGHNSREFRAENVDPERVHLNRCYVNENIKEVYEKLFGQALKDYNEKQTRADRKIPNYYEKIRTSKQERLFYEIIVQVGNHEDMHATSDEGKIAAEILEKYMQGFIERNPTLHVFSAHLHMDEATPHLHIDFVPFSDGNKRGLETKNSLKGALAILGFTGGSRGSTELTQWQNAEKDEVAQIMLEYGIEWEKKGQHLEHLSVLDFKKQERAKEVAEIEKTLEVVQEKEVKLRSLNGVVATPAKLARDKVVVNAGDFEEIRTLAGKHIVGENRERELQQELNIAQRKNYSLKNRVHELVQADAMKDYDLIQLKHRHEKALRDLDKANRLLERTGHASVINKRQFER